MTEDEIRKHHESLTAHGPWRWTGQIGHQFHLATVDRGRQYVMGFERMGLRGAQPRFRDDCVAPGRDGVDELTRTTATMRPAKDLADREAPYRDDVADIDNAYAQYLSRSWEYIDFLLAELKDARRQGACDFGQRLAAYSADLESWAKSRKGYDPALSGQEFATHREVSDWAQDSQFAKEFVECPSCIGSGHCLICRGGSYQSVEAYCVACDCTHDCGQCRGFGLVKGEEK